MRFLKGDVLSSKYTQRLTPLPLELLLRHVGCHHWHFQVSPCVGHPARFDCTEFAICANTHVPDRINFSDRQLESLLRGHSISLKMRWCRLGVADPLSLGGQLVWLAGKEFLGSEPWKRWWINFVFLTWENGKRMTRSLRAMKAKSQGYQPCVYDCRCQPHKANKQRWHVKSETYCIGLLSQIVSAQIVSKNRKAREKSKVPRLHYKIIELGPRKNCVRVKDQTDQWELEPFSFLLECKYNQPVWPTCQYFPVQPDAYNL